MLDVALKFERAFARYEEEDDKFVSYFLENENGKSRIGPPIYSDWQATSVSVKFLGTFYEVTLQFSNTLQVTSNNFFHEICEVHTTLTDLSNSKDSLLSSMVVNMKGKYNKYWGDAEDINPLLFLAVVIDPIQDGISKVSENNIQSNTGSESRKMRLLEIYLHHQKMETTEKNDVDHYLADELLNPMTSSFDILLWWKENSKRFSRLLRNLPSVSGHILDPFRSSLSPKMLEALVCTQSWLKG
ncbi:zinc finger BED domain-containing protein RICESLEEPER 2-like [Apium graveolens]|uniref:zinc finger BED domain-containing protein RICESLEEPER 2-like n=1 Tax=Apium graveolens TaxID=4045 RepID=UPI003D7BB565